jgi:hypothetical protein
MEPFKPIMANVVKIIDEYTVIIDAGYKKGVSLGMKFVIYSEGGEIQDLDGNSLGKVEFPKAQVEVTHVQEKMSIARNLQVVTFNPAMEIAEALGNITYSTRKELPVNSDSIERVAPVDKNVKVGDKVRQIGLPSEQPAS